MWAVANAEGLCQYSVHVGTGRTGKVIIPSYDDVRACGGVSLGCVAML